jgi:type I restriction enzyme M protein
MITNPPFGVSWKSEQTYIEEESKSSIGRFLVGTPRTSDGSLLFLQHLISKMKDEGSRIGIVLSGSPLFSGDCGSGESEIRKWIIENDLLEGIISLPSQLFFNTDISTYIWLLTNKKEDRRKGKIQLIDGSNLFEPMKKSLGNKRKKISDSNIKTLLSEYSQFENSDISRIFENKFFGYTKVTVERPLKIDGVIQLKKDGSPKPDPKLRDTERIPLLSSIQDYYEEELKKHWEDCWIDQSDCKIGYEINFPKYFFQYKPLRPLSEIVSDLKKLENIEEELLKPILDGRL